MSSGRLRDQHWQTRCRHACFSTDRGQGFYRLNSSIRGDAPRKLPWRWRCHLNQKGVIKQRLNAIPALCCWRSSWGSGGKEVILECASHKHISQDIKQRSPRGVCSREVLRLVEVDAKLVILSGHPSQWHWDLWSLKLDFPVFDLSLAMLHWWGSLF